MKTTVLPLKMRHLCSLALGALLYLASVQLITPVFCQAVYTSPYTFATVAEKSRPDSVSGKILMDFAPKGLTLDAAGNIYFADTRRQVICRMTPSGAVTIIAGQPDSIGSADGAGNQARFNSPRGVAMDADGNLYVADSRNNTIRRVTPGGMVTTFAGLPGVVGCNDGSRGYARFNFPNGVAVDKSGNVYVADLYNSIIRKVTPGGNVTTLAGQPGVEGSANGRGGAALFNFPISIAVDGSDNVYVADMLNNAIRKITPDGMVTTLAGRLSYLGGNADGPGSASRFCHPCGLAVDRTGTIYVADSGNNTLRRITPAGVVSTLGGVAGQSGNSDGSGSAARFWHPTNLALDGPGNLYVADSDNTSIRKGCPAISTNSVLACKTPTTNEEIP